MCGGEAYGTRSGVWDHDDLRKPAEKCKQLVQRKLSFCYIDAADEKSGKSIWRLLNIRCTRIERKWSGDMKLGLIMLAAGNSRRFGSNKLLYGIDGMPMYRHILLELKKVKAALEEQGHRCEITVVTQYEEIAQEAEKLGAWFLYNLHPDEGISSSLKIGLGVNREMDACLFTVADQPWLRWETVFGLVDVFLREGKGIACVEHDGKTGNPCVFSKKYYGELMELSGDVGGKRVVVAHRGDVAVMKVEDGREMVDVDFADGRR